MTEKIKEIKNKIAKSNEAPTNQQQQAVDKKLITLSGITTSQINQALKAKSPYPARVFLKLVDQEQDIPVFFRIKETPIYEGFIKENAGKYVSYSKCYNRERGNKCLYDDIQHCGECSDKLKQEFKSSESWIRPKIKKGSYLQVEGHFNNSDKERKSFTALSYQVLDQFRHKAQTAFNHWAKRRLANHG